jgi:hypothetical protein
MKILFLAALVAMISTAATAQVCSLSKSDITALAASKSKLTERKFLALAPDGQQWVCKTRADIKELDAHNGVYDDPKNQTSYRPIYLSPAENDRMDLANTDAILTRKK